VSDPREEWQTEEERMLYDAFTELGQYPDECDVE
jgi:hypothetical protein